MQVNLVFNNDGMTENEQRIIRAMFELHLDSVMQLTEVWAGVTQQSAEEGPIASTRRSLIERGGRILSNAFPNANVRVDFPDE